MHPEDWRSRLTVNGAALLRAEAGSGPVPVVAGRAARVRQQVTQRVFRRVAEKLLLGG